MEYWVEFNPEKHSGTFQQGRLFTSRSLICDGLNITRYEKVETKEEFRLALLLPMYYVVKEVLEEKELDLDPYYQEDLGGPGSGHRGHKGIPGSQGGSIGRGLKVVPKHIWEQAGKRTGFKAVRNTVKKLRTSKVLPASKKTKWFYRIEVEGKLRGFLVGENAVAKTVLGRGMKPKEGSVEITLERDKELDVRASLGNLLTDEVKARLDTDYGAMDWNVLFEEDPDDALALVIEAKLRQDLVLGLTDYQEDLGGPGSGHHGHKGTKGSQGGSTARGGIAHYTKIDPQLYGQWANQIKDEWKDERKGADRRLTALGALNLLKRAEAGEETVDMFAIVENKKLMAIASVSPMIPTFGGKVPERPREFAEIAYLATKQRGFGRQMMYRMLEKAHKDKQGVEWRALSGAVGFYKKLGFTPKRGRNNFQLSLEEVGVWLETAKP